MSIEVVSSTSIKVTETLDVGTRPFAPSAAKDKELIHQVTRARTINAGVRPAGRGFCTVYRGAAEGRVPVIPECCPIRSADQKADEGVGTTTGNWRNFNVFWDRVNHGNVVELPIVRATLTDVMDELLQEEIG